MIEIAKKEFNIEDHQPLKLLCEDAETFVQTATDRYGLIIIDLFLDLQVPDQFFSISFWKNIKTLLGQEGKVLFNAGINSAHETQINYLLENDTFGMNFRKQEEVYGSNTLLLGERV